MSLYHEAAAVLDAARGKGGSVKSIVFGKKDWKTDPKLLFALSTEAAKWSEVLAEVVERSGLLKAERQLSPTLALILSHDLLLSRRGIALPLKHGLTASVTRHKARLTSELTKARLKRGFATLEQLRDSVNKAAISAPIVDSTSATALPQPRWVRVNSLRTTLAQQLATTFAEYKQVSSLQELTQIAATPADDLRVYSDHHVPNLVAVPFSANIAKTTAFQHGELILQDKASCFPAYLLGSQAIRGDMIDTCAAPGNKTTHLAAIVGEYSWPHTKIFACEKDAVRSLTLQKMVNIAGGEKLIRVKAKQDFLKLDPDAKEHANVTSLLLDPSCSGSGIIGRDEAVLNVHLPDASADFGSHTSKKRKRERGSNGAKDEVKTMPVPVEAIAEDLPSTDAVTEEEKVKLQTRLTNLSAFQLRLLEHAMAFPAARRISYSTCSVHAEENEHVVVRALQSDVATKQGWRILRREEQVEGMKKWHCRGLPGSCEGVTDAGVVANACIRCIKGGADGTMGFFVACFTRDGAPSQISTSPTARSDLLASGGTDEHADSGDEWEGFGEDSDDS